jgi:hypothetical protein
MVPVLLAADAMLTDAVALRKGPLAPLRITEVIEYAGSDMVNIPPVTVTVDDFSALLVCDLKVSVTSSAGKLLRVNTVYVPFGMVKLDRVTCELFVTLYLFTSTTVRESLVAFVVE